MEPAGARYLRLCAARANSHCLGDAGPAAGAADDDDDDEESSSAAELVLEDDINFLRTLCPKEWKVSRVVPDAGLRCSYSSDWS